VQFFCVCFGQWAWLRQALNWVRFGKLAILLCMLSILEACALGFAMAQAALFLAVACDPICNMGTAVGLCLFSPPYANAKVHFLKTISLTDLKYYLTN